MRREIQQTPRLHRLRELATFCQQRCFPQAENGHSWPFRLTFAPEPPLFSPENLVPYRNRRPSHSSVQAYAAARLRRVEVNANVGVPPTVAALMIETLIGSLLSQQSEITNSSITLFPDRSADAQRLRINSLLLDRIERPTNHLNQSILISAALTELEQQLANPTNNVTDLLTLADLIYTIHSREVDASTGSSSLGSLAGNPTVINDFVAGEELTGAAARSYVSPVDTLRQFIESGTVPAVYLEDPALTPALLTAAATGLAQAYSAVRPRPFVQLTLQSSFASVGGDYLELQDAQFNPYILLTANGRPFRLPPNLSLSSATFLVRGYSDVNLPEGFFGNGIEVISVELLALPPSTGEDNDGNLLADNWERLFYGDTGNDPFAIPGDGSGWTILQRYLAGENPGAPVGPARNLAPPNLSLSANGNDTVTLNWEWPFEFANDVTFGLLDAGSVPNGFNQRVEGPANIGQDQFGVTVPTAGADHRFYRVTMQLKVPFLHP